jgi:deoxyribodipyrimidine photo-lyase
MATPAERIRLVNPAPLRGGGRFVAYWMTAQRRAGWNYGLERAVELARELGKPLLVVEPLRCDGPYASDRLHAFAIQGMAENARRLRRRALYHPWLEPSPGDEGRFLEALAAEACVLVADDWPDPLQPDLLDRTGGSLAVRVEAVDSCGILPFRLAARDFATAFLFRRYVQRELARWIERRPSPDPLARARLPGLPILAALPPALARRWPAVPAAALARPAPLLAALPIDHRVSPVGQGGSAAAEARLDHFLQRQLDRYLDDRSAPDADGTSALSPWLHFGHLGSHQVVAALLAREQWSLAKLSAKAGGHRSGFWGVSEPAEAFLDQLVTWREVGFATAAHRPGFRTYDSLPDWAKETLAAHASDRRDPVYDRAALEEARTGDPLWNAAQRQLRQDGVIHNTLRMLWGKKVLEWSRTPREALETLLDLNDRYALDGRDPNSVSGIFWCLGRYDRPWGPERPIFGKVRYMSSANTARKVPVRRYLSRYGPT